MLRWVVMKSIEKIRTEESRARACVATISEKIRETTAMVIGHVERKTEEDVVIRTWKLVDTKR